MSGTAAHERGPTAPMPMLVIGGADDVLGFRLAGVDGVVTETEASVLDALARARRDRRLLLVVVSARAAALAVDPVRVFAAESSLPLVLVLPERTP